MRKLLGPVLYGSLVLLACTRSNVPADDGGAEVDSSRHCEPCEDAVQLRIQGVSNPEDVSVEGAEVMCQDAGTFIYCGIRTLEPGEYTLTVTAPGMVPQEVFFSLGEPITVGGCTCPAIFSRLITLSPMP